MQAWNLAMLSQSTQDMEKDPLWQVFRVLEKKGIPYYESSSDEEDEGDDLYMGRSMYSNTGHFRNFAFDTNSVTDLIHCMEGYESYIEDFLWWFW